MRSEAEVAQKFAQAYSTATKARYDCALQAPFLDEADWRMLAALDLYDRGTVWHSIRVAALAREQVLAYHELPDGSMIRFADLFERSGIGFARFYRACLLHDVGKIVLPKELLFKRGRFTTSERTAAARHESVSRQMLAFAGRGLEADIAGQHHNYGREEARSKFFIPRLGIWAATADLVRLADTQEALLSRRVYKPPLKTLAVLRIMVEMARDGEVGRELACLWIGREFKRLDLSYLNRAAIPALNAVGHLREVSEFLEEEYVRLARLCSLASLAEPLPDCAATA